jgi:osmotically-inducible protein OsmY
MKSNETLQKEIQDALKWEPQLNAAEIGVIVKDGIVTLTGTVDNYSKKIEAENATKKVGGVKVVVEHIEVDYGHIGRNDNEIALAVLEALKWDKSIDEEKIKVKVQDGWIYLEGAVNWDYQRQFAKNAVEEIIGVKGVVNNIKINSEINDFIEKKAIEKALERNSSLNKENINVEVDGNKVTLSGVVDAYYQKDEAERIAWNAPGVWSVNNELAVGSFD